MPVKGRAAEEIARRGRELYDTHLRALLEQRRQIVNARYTLRHCLASLMFSTLGYQSSCGGR